MSQPLIFARFLASSSVYTGPIGFVGFENAGSSGSISTIVRIDAIGFSIGRRLPNSCSII